MTNLIKLARGTRAALEARALAGTLAAGEPYYITDEGVTAVGTGPTTYSVTGEFDPTGTDLTEETTQGAIAELAEAFFGNAQIRQIAILGDGTSRNTNSTTSYGSNLGQTAQVVPKSPTSKLLVLASAGATIARAANALFGFLRIDWYNGSVYAVTSEVYRDSVVGMQATGATAIDIRQDVSAFSIFGASEKNGSGNWQFGLRGMVSTGSNSPLLTVANCKYIAAEIEGL